MPTRNEWKDGKIVRMLNKTVFYTDGFKSATGTKFKTYGLNKLTFKNFVQES